MDALFPGSPGSSPLDAELPTIGTASRDLDTSKWTTVYPLYLDAKRTCQQGRRVSRELAVENPNPFVIGEAVRSLGLQVVIESKRHPATPFNIGRCKVDLRDSESKRSKSDIKDKKELLRRIAQKYQEAAETMKNVEDPQIQHFVKVFSYEYQSQPQVLLQEWKTNVSGAAGSASASNASAATTSSASNAGNENKKKNKKRK